MPKVSVIITAYNYGRFLGEAIRSVLDQTFPDFELIIVDDGSTDNTREVVDSFKDPRIKYMYQENRGVAGAADTGLRAASGEYVLYLGADDILMTGTLEKEVEVLDRHPEVSFSYGQAYLMDERRHVFGLSKQCKRSYIREGREEIKKAILSGNHVRASTIMSRRNCLREDGLFDEAFRSGSEDFDKWVRMARSHSVAYIAAPLLYYRFHTNNLCGKRQMAEVERSSSLILERLFNDPELGQLFSPLRPRAYFHLYLRLADYAHGRRDKKTSNEYLLRAVKMQPKWFFKRLWLPYITRLARTLLPKAVLDSAQRARRSLRTMALSCGSRIRGMVAVIRRKISLYYIKFGVAVRDFGLKHALLRILQDGLFGKFFLCRQYIIYEKQLVPSDPPKLRNSQLEFSFASSDDNRVMEQIEKLSGLSREMVSEKIKNGGECVVARNNGSLAGFNLVSIGKAYMRYLEGYINLAESEAWSEQITVAPEHRQGGLATDIRYLMFDRLVKRGYEKLIGGYVPFNVKSGLLAKKLGFVEREKVTLVRILMWKKLYVQKLSANPIKSLSLTLR